MGEGDFLNKMSQKNIQLAKALRTNQTDAELKMWQALRAGRLLNYKFRRQVPMGDYIVDFVYFEQRLIIEVDGGQHLESQTDLARDVKLNSLGFRVLRFWNNQVFDNLEGVLAMILHHLQAHTPLPQGARGF